MAKRTVNSTVVLERLKMLIDQYGSRQKIADKIGCDVSLTSLFVDARR